MKKIILLTAFLIGCSDKDSVKLRTSNDVYDKLQQLEDRLIYPTALTVVTSEGKVIYGDPDAFERAIRQLKCESFYEHIDGNLYKKVK